MSSLSGTAARTRRGIFLADTSYHESFVKILQTFRAGSAMQLPMLWKGDYLGVLICACCAGSLRGAGLRGHGDIRSPRRCPLGGA
jgi:hypothetical protein